MLCNILTLKYPQIQSQGIYFSKFSCRGMSPDPLALACYTCWLWLHNNTYNPSLHKRLHFKYMPLIREHIVIPGSPSLSYALFPGGSYHFAPPVFRCISFWPPLAKILKETLMPTAYIITYWIHILISRCVGRSKNYKG